MSVRGGCLCGAVRYEVRGALRPVVLCHCVQCRRWHGHFSAFTSARREDLVLLRGDELRWYGDAPSEAGARRGFCGRCGTSLLWDAPSRSSISIAAGSLEEPTGLRSAAHIYVDEAGGYYELPDDSLPRHDRAAG